MGDSYTQDRLRSLLISRKIFYELHISIFLKVLNAYVNMPLHKHSLIIQQITPEIRNYFVGAFLHQTSISEGGHVGGKH
ncbi:uncharacterized protein LOC135671388 isoform X4 [Musa acuminata AAA Group]|uniref:uncharacterized protein LOC135670982 isoform X4 n=1 Tax=Musa acuminata AAA Group TaxID=214697 RepID=UPI0031DF0794